MGKTTLLEALNRQFSNTPNNTAIVYEGKYLTYRMLNRRVNQLALYIINLGIINEPISFCLCRGPEIIITMLAILRSGNFYVPLDIIYPVERIKYILSDTHSPLIITNINNEQLLETFSKHSQIINLNEIQYLVNKINDINIPTTKQKLAYIIYTSGTTGIPKGVIVKRKSLLNLSNNAIRILHDKRMNVLHFISPGFDAAGWDIYPTLLIGSTIIIPNDKIAQSPSKLYKFMLQNEINVVTLTPAILSQIPLIKIDTMEKLVVMGDKPDSKYMDFWSNNCIVFNGYGPTETTIGATINRYKIGNQPGNIGKSFENYNIYLLNDDLNKVNKGEIYIGGLGVAVGYWNNNELTKQKFIKYNNDIVYKTGDLAQYDENNDLIFIGRLDNQIKINGIRIELEEIESLIKKLEYIKDACVIFSDNQLTVYYTLNNLKQLNNSGELIKLYLSSHLHRTVVPKRYQQIDNFILTTNGKIDKRSLPKYSVNSELINATNSYEKILIDICKLVFQCDFVGRNTDIFEIGANSLNIHQIITKLKKYNLYVEPTDIFKYPIISNLVRYITQLKENHKITNLYNDMGIYKLTQHQLNLWYYQQMYPDDVSYNTSLIYKFTGNLNVGLMILSLQKIINKHCAIRIKINIINGIPMQYFEKYTLPIEYIFPEILPMDSIRLSIKNDVNTKFNMINEHLCKFKLYKNSNVQNCWVLSIIAHNIIIDAYSINIIKNDLENIYNNKKIKNLCKITYVNYIEHNLQCFANNTNILTYWKEQLNEFVPLSLPKTMNDNCGVSIKEINLPNLERFISKLKTTKYIVLMTAFNILFSRYKSTFTTNCDLSFGTQIADRYDPNFMQTVGFMVSTLIIRNKFNLNITVCDLIKQITETLHDVIDNRYITYDQLVTICNSKIDVMIVMQNTGINDKIKLNNINTEIFNVETKTAFPIYIDIFDNGNTQTIRIRHSKDYCNKFITQMLESFEIILHDIIENHECCVSKVKYLNNDSIIYGNKINWNTTTINDAIFDRSNFDEYLQAIMYSTDDNDYLDSNITYGILNEESNKIAHCLLQKYNIKIGDVIAVEMGRCKELIILLIAILKIGACYLPIDSNYPQERIDYMINDSKSTIVISNTQKHSCIMYDTILENAKIIDCNIDINLSKPKSLAYIIYTSGSTGNPKSVMITHESVLNVLNHFKMELQIHGQDKIWNLTSPSFDIMVLEIFLPLISGCRLLICPMCISTNPVLLTKWINKEKPTILQATPTQFSLIAEHIESDNNLTILVGGEPLTNKIKKSLLQITNKVYNVYGPTETTIWSTISKLNYNDTIDIGKPISNTNCIVLNEIQQSVPNGCIGELYIGGIGLSKGYLNNKELTDQVFINYDGKTFYRTGDLVKVNNMLNLEYIGRTDLQVKIRGHRIELEEITYVMESHKSVKRAIVIIKQNDGKYFIIAYYIGIEDKTIIEYMRSKLPIFMIPNFVILLPLLPKTLNNKIDMKQLPTPFNNNLNLTFVMSGEHVKPKNDLEQMVHDLFVKIIGCPEISINESILNVGATSIMFPQFISKIKEKFNIKLTMEQFISNSTVLMCAKLLNDLFYYKTT